MNNKEPNELYWGSELHKQHMRIFMKHYSDDYVKNRSIDMYRRNKSVFSSGRMIGYIRNRGVNSVTVVLLCILFVLCTFILFHVV